MASTGLVAVHKSIIASLHQECVLSPFERVKTIQRISADDEERSPCIRRNLDNKSNSKDNRIDAKFLHTPRERVDAVKFVFTSQKDYFAFMDEMSEFLIVIIPCVLYLAYWAYKAAKGEAGYNYYRPRKRKAKEWTDEDQKNMEERDRLEKTEKKCAQCKESINYFAKRCPYCRSKQGDVYDPMKRFGF